jgi:hypothetical protein
MDLNFFHVFHGFIAHLFLALNNILSYVTRHQWLTPIILAIQEAEIRRVMV